MNCARAKYGYFWVRKEGRHTKELQYRVDIGCLRGRHFDYCDLGDVLGDTGVVMLAMDDAGQVKQDKR